jgi:hypothetical protein
VFFLFAVVLASAAFVMAVSRDTILRRFAVALPVTTGVFAVVSWQSEAAKPSELGDSQEDFIAFLGLGVTTLVTGAVLGGWLWQRARRHRSK